MEAKPFKTAEIVLTELEKREYFDTFGHEYWNDSENIIFIPMSYFLENRIHMKYALYEFFDHALLDDTIEGIFIDLNK